METKKTIQDIKSSNTGIISDMVSEPVIMLKKNENTIFGVHENDSEPSFNTIKNNSDVDNVNQNEIFENKKIGFIFKIPNMVKEVNPLYAIFGLVILIAIIFLLFVPSSSSQKNIQSDADKESKMVKDDLSKHMVIPENEQIDIRKITSKPTEPFFNNAEPGDYLVIFYNERIAYIYSVKRNLIVNAGVVLTSTSTDQTTNKISK